ncbi:MAG: ATP-binding protein [Hormoscilla sp.]
MKQLLSKIKYYLLAFIVLETVTVLGLSKNQATKEEILLSKHVAELQTAYRVIVETYQLVSQTIYDEVVNQPEIIDIFTGAYQADATAQTQKRDRLFAALNPTYQNLRKKNLKQLHFHLPDSTSFLRFHRPPKFGDNLSDVRYSVNLTNQEKRFVKGFEEGRIYNGFRYVFPLFARDKSHIGSVETSVSFQAIRLEMDKLFSGVHTFMLKKAVVSAKVFADEQSNYVQSDISDDYLYEKSSLESKKQTIAPDILAQVNQQLQPQISDRLNQGEAFAVSGSLGTETYVVTFAPIDNVEGDLVAYIISHEQDVTIGSYRQEFYVQLVAMTLLSILFLLFVFYVNRSKKIVEERKNELSQSNQQLEQEIVQRTKIEAELVNAKEAAEAANKTKSAFLANMSHELRTPMNAILGFTQLMTRSQNLSPENQENLGIISRSGEHLLTLINNVLDLSKIEAGRTTLNESNFDLYRLMDDLEEMFQFKADDQRLQLLFDRTDEVPQYVRTDKVKLRQVLINLLNNAIKFTESGGVSVRMGIANSQSLVANGDGQGPIAFEVEDTGPGIAPEELDSLFTAFVQTESGKASQEGTGLGLPISRKFVELMGGNITVSSKLGHGTIFRFDIQATVVDAADIETPRSTHRVIALEPDQPRYRLLIVDDKWNNRQLLIKLLNPLGFELREANNGQEAIDIWGSWEPDLIWMDMRMPVMNGYEATKHIKETTKGQATAIVALTASVLEEERAVIISAGCDDFLRKPFREADIFDAMHKHIGVRYVYADPNEAKSEATADAAQLTTAAFAALPPELLAKLKQALVNVDLDLIDSLSSQISKHNPALAQALADAIDNFEYDKILNLLPEEI